ncbi:NB-ARC domain-containing protein [Amycolatopsis panacis]|uniref:NACHT domain-containing protein n=1 Tax=Amycolatopsis panacis TaxID=2340917 RepID=A0A419I4X7_9PSEU|nr:NB-ARC domain-containing protein [Amycolatopsis panacis]RJQ85580.1 NACHT domain-containing protein [Amycolatopsis panacis]
MVTLPEHWYFPMLPSFVNRTDEILDAGDLHRKACAAGEPLLIRIVGERGVGKTVFALYLAHLLAEHYPDGGFFLEADGSAPAGELARQLLLQRGVPERDIPADQVSRLAAARRCLHGKRTILVIDDVSRVEQVSKLLVEAPGSAVLVTGRSRLEGDCFRRFVEFELDGFNDDATGELLRSIADTVDLSEETVKVLREKCGGSPLLISASAGQLARGRVDPAQFVHKLSLHDLPGISTLSPSAVFRVIHDELPAEQQSDYRLLSRIPGNDFGIALAAEVLGCTERAAVARMNDLVDRYLLGIRDGGRYRFRHMLLREHAIGMSFEHEPAAAEEAEYAAAKWLVHRSIALEQSYLPRPAPCGGEDLYATIPPAYAPGQQDSVAQAAREYAVEWPNLLAAAEFCADRQIKQLALVAPMALCSFAYQTHRSDTLIGHYERAVELSSPVRVRWQLLRDLAQLSEGMGDGENTVRYATLALETGYEPGRESAYTWLALGYELLGRMPEALAALDSGIAAVALMEDPAQQVRARTLLMMHYGRIAAKSKQPEQAWSAFSEAREYFAAAHEDGNVARCDDWLAQLSDERGDAQAAEEKWQSAATGYGRAGMHRQANAAFRKLAELARRQDRIADADTYLKRAAEYE